MLLAPKTEVKGRLIVDFVVEGQPRPHSFEVAALGWAKNDRARVDHLRRWQDRIKEAAREAMADAPPFDGNVRAKLAFGARPRGDRPLGSPWTTPVDAKGGRCDRLVPDLDNLVKGALDSLEGIVLVNDCQVSAIEAAKVYAQAPGVRIEVYAL